MSTISSSSSSPSPSSTSPSPRSSSSSGSSTLSEKALEALEALKINSYYPPALTTVTYFNEILDGAGKDDLPQLVHRSASAMGRVLQECEISLEQVEDFPALKQLRDFFLSSIKSRLKMEDGAILKGFEKQLERLHMLDKTERKKDVKRNLADAIQTLEKVIADIKNVQEKAERLLDQAITKI